MSIQTKSSRETMSAAQLKAAIEAKGEEPYFFSRQTMAFFGDRMSNYGVRSARIETYGDRMVDCWELYRKHPVKHGLIGSAYFDKKTLRQAFGPTT